MELGRRFFDTPYWMSSCSFESNISCGFMKLELPCACSCSECAANGGTPFSLTSLPINDTCIYEVSCPYGHKSLMHAQAYKFELLFESGIKALKDGYNREAATSFAVALERFYEFSIGILLIDKLSPNSSGSFNETALKKYERLWKTYLKLSERQLGAFYGLYFNEFEEMPLMFDEALSKSLKHKLVANPVNFRNRVVHEGYIPSHEEVIEYGQAVHFYMESLLQVYREKDKSRKLSRMFYMTWLELVLSFKKRGEIPRQIPGTGIMKFFCAHSPNKQSFADYIEYGAPEASPPVEGTPHIKILSIIVC